jgi:hypothetical protein
MAREAIMVVASRDLTVIISCGSRAVKRLRLSPPNLQMSRPDESLPRFCRISFSYGIPL